MASHAKNQLLFPHVHAYYSIYDVIQYCVEKWYFKYNTVEIEPNNNKDTNLY